jgi:hypothetical protein
MGGLPALAFGSPWTFSRKKAQEAQKQLFRRPEQELTFVHFVPFCGHPLLPTAYQGMLATPDPRALMLVPVAQLQGELTVRLVDSYGSDEQGTPDVIWASIVDSSDRAARVCIDQRKGSSTRHRLFDRAKHPKESEAVLIELGSSEEATVVGLLSEWCDDTSNRLSYGGGYWDWFVDAVQMALVRIGSLD